MDETSISPQEHRNRLDTLIHQKNNVTTTDNRLCEYFCSETIFNLSKQVPTDAEIKVFGKRPGLRSYYEKIKWVRTNKWLSWVF